MKNPLSYKLIGFLLIFHFCYSNVIGQAPVWKYAKTGSGTSIQDMQADSSGNLYLASYFYTTIFEYQDKTVSGLSGGETTNMVLFKTDPTGKPIWMHSIRGTSIGTSINFNNLAISERGELVVSFTVSNTSKVIIDKYSAPTDPAHDNVFIAKFSKSGFLVWVKYLYSEGSSTPVVSVSDLLIDENGVAYIAGGFTGANAYIGSNKISGLGDYTMMFISKIESQGNIAWARGCSYGSGTGGNIIANKITLSKSGILFVTGTYSGYRQYIFGSDSTNSEMSNNTFIAGYSQTGTPNWGRFITGILNEYPENLLVANNNDVYLFGYSNSNPVNIMGHAEDNSGGNYDLYIVHLSSSGIYISSKTFTTQIPNLPFGKSVFRIDKYNNVILGTEFYANTIFTSTAIITNPDPGTSDLAFAKLNGTTLDPIWRVHGTGSGENNLDDTYIDPSGNIAMSGTLYNNITIAGSLITGNTSNGAPYLFRITKDGSLDYTFQKVNDINNYMNVSKTALDIYGNTYIMGSFTGPANKLGDQALIRPMNSGMFLAKYANTKNICGIIYNPLGEIVNKGYVIIFGYTYFQRSPLNDSIPINADGSYCFSDLPLGRYIICAFPQGEFENIYVPTYYTSELNWEHADMITIEIASATAGYDIVLVDRTPFTGIAGLGGNLQQADSNNIYKSTSSVSWKPSQRATVVLASKRKIKSTDDFYAEIETDDFGDFSFYDVPDGSYYLWVEIPGLPSDEYLVIVEGGGFISSLDFLVDEENVYLLSKPSSNPKYKEDLNENWAFPNPAFNEIFVTISENEYHATIKIYDLRGSLIYKSDCIPGINKINATDFAPGTYFIKLTTKNSIHLQKISILH
jgi:hypothetical protein